MRIECFDSAEAARRIGISRRTLEGWRCRAHQVKGIHGPPWLVLPGSGQFNRVVYPARQLLEWIRKRDAAALEAATERARRAIELGGRSMAGLRKRGM